jgi:hypothetical protein
MFRSMLALITVAFSLAVIRPALSQDTTAAPADSTDWREQYAYSVGVQAYIYSYGLLTLTGLRHQWVTDPESIPYSALNHLYHFRNIADPSYKSGGSPNNDTLYSWGFFDLSKEPVVLAHPDMGNRYFVFELADMYSDNFGYVGKRATGSKASAFLIAGPGWNGEKPADVRDVIRSPTPYALVFGRSFVEGKEDVPAVNRLQDQFQVVPLGLWGKQDAKLPESRDVWAPYDSKSDPLADWKTINRAMAENPPAAKDEPLLPTFATVGIGPGLTDALEKQDEATKRGLAKAAADGHRIVEGMVVAGAGNKMVKGWLYPPADTGRAGLVNDFRSRATCAAAGIICNESAEAVYMPMFVDSDGSRFDGAHRYTLRFEKDGLPPVDGFWSVTMYGPDYNLVANPINRFAIRDRTPGLKRAADGSLTLYLQSDSPGGDKEANWLPTPKQGAFFVTLRNYGPRRPIIDQTWQPPVVKQQP